MKETKIELLNCNLKHSELINLELIFNYMNAELSDS